MIKTGIDIIVLICLFINLKLLLNRIDDVILFENNTIVRLYYITIIMHILMIIMIIKQ